MISLARIENASTSAVVFLGLEDEGLVGYDPMRDVVFGVEPRHMIAAVSADPAAVFFGLDVAWAQMEERRVANRRLPLRLVGSGSDFGTLPEGVVSGFPTAAPTIRHHRKIVPSDDTIRVTAMFALSTVRASIEDAETSYDCVGQLYLQRGRQMPSVADMRRCFHGLAETKSRQFVDASEYAPVIRAHVEAGLKDRELREALATETELPVGLGLSKLSLVLALLGHDLVCIDARLQQILFETEKMRTRFDKRIAKRKGTASTSVDAVRAYEEVEDRFLDGNPYYDPRDPLGRARAQWMSWEAVGGKPASHGVWLSMLPSWRDVPMVEA